MFRSFGGARVCQVFYPAPLAAGKRAAKARLISHADAIADKIGVFEFGEWFKIAGLKVKGGLGPGLIGPAWKAPCPPPAPLLQGLVRPTLFKEIHDRLLETIHIGYCHFPCTADD